MKGNEADVGVVTERSHYEHSDILAGFGVEFGDTSWNPARYSNRIHTHFIIHFVAVVKNHRSLDQVVTIQLDLG